MLRTTAAQMILTVRQRTEIGLDANGFVTDTELLDYLNASIKEVHGLLFSKVGGQYYRNRYQIQVQPGQDTYPLPYDYLKLQKVRYQLTPLSSGIWQPMLRFDEAQEDMFSPPWGPAQLGIATMRYREENNNIKFIPSPNLPTMVVEVAYMPKCPELVAGVQASFQMDSVIAGMGILYSAKYAGTPGNALTITHLTPAGSTTTASVAAGMSTTDITLAPKVGETNFGAVMAMLNVADVTRLVNLDVIGDPTDPIAAQTVQALVGGAGTIGITDWDGFNGWEELAVADVCIKVAAKNRRDPSQFQDRKTLLLQRMNQEMENRDQGQPHTGIDSYGQDNWGGYDGFGRLGYM